MNACFYPILTNPPRTISDFKDMINNSIEFMYGAAGYAMEQQSDKESLQKLLTTKICEEIQSYNYFSELSENDRKELSDFIEEKIFELIRPMRLSINETISIYQ